MIRFPTLVAATFAVALSAIAYADAAPAVAQMTGVAGETLTLTSAKQLVSQKLAAEGKRNLRPGSATFDGDGNVAVEIVTLQGLPVSHVVVRADNGMITDARTGKTAAKG